MPAGLLLEQLSQMSAALLAGCACGLAFDLYQKICYGTARRPLRPAAYWRGDLLFGLALLVVWLLFWFGCTDGSLRWAVLLWVVIGAALYFFLLRRRVDALWRHRPRLKRQRRLRPLEHGLVERCAGGWLAAGRGWLALRRRWRRKNASGKDSIHEKEQ